jgi:hypothetical protein
LAGARASAREAKADDASGGNVAGELKSMV